MKDYMYMAQEFNDTINLIPKLQNTSLLVFFKCYEYRYRYIDYGVMYNIIITYIHIPTNNNFPSKMHDKTISTNQKKNGK